MIELRETKEGVVLPVKALPGARKNEFRGVQAGALKIAVTQAAEKGKANTAILTLLASELGLKKSQLELLSGPTSGRKEILLRGLTAAELRAKLTL